MLQEAKMQLEISLLFFSIFPSPPIPSCVNCWLYIPWRQSGRHFYIFEGTFLKSGRTGKHFSIPVLAVTGRREDMGLTACSYCFHLRFLVLSTHFLLQLMKMRSEPCTKLVPVGTDAPSSPGSSGGIRKEKPSQMYQNWWSHNQDLAQFYSIYSQEDSP